MTSAIAELIGVDVWLGEHQVLHQVDLRVDPGEVVALLGGNGSGKTTALRALLGLVSHQQGRISLFGTPIHRFTAWHRLGYVPQRSHQRIPNATVREIVSMGRLSQRRLFRPLSRSDRIAIDEALEQVGVPDLAGKSINRLSGGQQQRTLIARALASRADFLILDEPLAALDLHTQISLAHLLGELHSNGLTILMVLHELATMAPLLTRSIVLQHGRVSYDGPLAAELPPQAGGRPKQQALLNQPLSQAEEKAS